ncbi:MAG: YaiI/YqxD family protein [Rhizobiaceae bacterium]|nr:YaiI/YqxD family protein [Rhizobiaceae bacterium]
MIYIDADACPVKNEVLKVAERHDLVVTFVANGGLRPSRDPMVRNIVVSQGADVADDWIVEHATKNDIVITADIPLAGRCLENGVLVLGPTGKKFDPTNIGMAKAMRELNQHLRETGESKGYNKAFEPADRSRFLSALEEAVRAAKSSVKNSQSKPN